MTCLSGTLGSDGMPRGSKMATVVTSAICDERGGSPSGLCLFQHRLLLDTTNSTSESEENLPLIGDHSGTVLDGARDRFHGK